MNKIRIFFAGDFCSKPSTSLIKVDDALKSLIQSCDIKVINFEVPLKPDTDLPKLHYERFFQNDDAPEFLKNIGFNLFSMANNHMFDWEEGGYYKTKKEFGDDAFGAGSYDEAYRVKVIDINGIKIGFLALCYSCGKPVFDSVEKKDGLAVPYINDLFVNHVIANAKNNVDYLFILPHDGIEYIDIPLKKTIAKYRDFIDYGADGVIGTHPHCPQGWEVYKNKPIFYSLGNFFFNSKQSPDYVATKPHWYEGLCVIIEIQDAELKYEVHSTRNQANLQLSLDNTIARDIHNKMICRYLVDPIMYKKYYQDVVIDDIGKQYAQMICGVFFDLGLMKSLKIIIAIIYRLFKRDKRYNLRFLELIRNQLYNSVLLEYMQRK